MSRYGGTVGDALKWDGVNYSPDRINVLKCLVEHKVQSILAGTYKADPINTFVKDEPHKKAKLAEGRLRLIMAVSLEDTMVDRMLYSEIMRRAVETDSPVKAGYSPLKNGFRRLASSFPKESLSIDKKAWDFSVPGWMIDLWRVFLEDLVGGGPDWWIKLHRCRFRELFEDPVFEFADGERASQKCKGIMKSGCFTTLLLNSLGQVIIALIVKGRLGIPWTTFWTVGDDTVECVPPDVEAYVKEIGRLGFNVKEYSVNPFVEFCGFLATLREVKPAYVRKHLFKAIYDFDRSWALKVNVYSFLYAYDQEAYSFFSDLLWSVTGQPPEPAELLRAAWSDVL